MGEIRESKIGEEGDALGEEGKPARVLRAKGGRAGSGREGLDVWVGKEGLAEDLEGGEVFCADEAMGLEGAIGGEVALLTSGKVAGGKRNKRGGEQEAGPVSELVDKTRDL